MRYIADLHIHSPFSRATSPESSPAGLAAWARVKGINIVGTGDFTHPGWFSVLKNELEPAEPGLFRLRDEISVPQLFPGLSVSDAPVRFVLSAEISSIYKRHGATRKVHNLLYVPDFASAAAINAKLAGIGNIESDGRPILGLDSRNLLEILLESAPEGFMVPAHIWTPWFSLFGSRSGFDSIEECFGDLSDHIFALETGLSSDPDMNRLISGLDRLALISNSDCHSPSKLGREANLFDTGFDYFSLRDSLKGNNRDTFPGTIEFFPEEGKYHADGHRDCRVCLEPVESRRLGNICPVCGKPLTIGVLHRVMELADREEPCYRPDSPQSSYIIPLTELLGEVLQVGPASKEVSRQYSRAIQRFGSEFSLLLNAPLDELRDYEPILAEAVDRMRNGRVIRRPGFDGEFGVITLFDDGELASIAGQSSLFGSSAPRRVRKKAVSRQVLPELDSDSTQKTQEKIPDGPNPQQQAAIQAGGARILVAAGPGTGKTFTLVSRIARILETGEAPPSSLVAITFTTKAADELRERLARRLGEQANRIFVGTFHSFCLEQLRSENPGLSVVGPDSRDRLLKRLLPDMNKTGRDMVRDEVAAHFMLGTNLSEQAIGYIDELVRLNAIDLDAIIPVLVQLMAADEELASRISGRVGYLFVDEFQDINRSQYDLVERLGEAANLFAIGDPDQAIYGFRGGDLRFFFRFAERGETTLLSLSTTYRSAPLIVQAATAVISRNLIRSGLPLEAYSLSVKGEIEHHIVPTAASEAELVVRRIEELMGGVGSFSIKTGRGGANLAGDQKGRSFADFAVLFRLGRQADELTEALERRGIPYQLVGATPYYLTPSMRGAYYLLQAATGSEVISDWLSLASELKGVGSATIERLDACMPLNGSFVDEFAKCDETGHTSVLFEELFALLKKIRSLTLEEDAGQALGIGLDFLGISRDSTEAKRLLQLAGSFGKDLDAFALHLRRYASATVYDSRAESVALMTCHSAKGLEFPVVFMTGLEERVFPCVLMGHPDVEEERRLFYVGLTRARERAVLVSSSTRKWLGTEQQEVCRFVNEIPASLLEKPVYSRPQKPREDDSAAAQMELF